MPCNGNPKNAFPGEGATWVFFAGADFFVLHPTMVILALRDIFRTLWARAGKKEATVNPRRSKKEKTKKKMSPKTSMKTDRQGFVEAVFAKELTKKFFKEKTAKTSKTEIPNACARFWTVEKDPKM